MSDPCPDHGWLWSALISIFVVMMVMLLGVGTQIADLHRKVEALEVQLGKR